MARKRTEPVNVDAPETGPRGPFPELASLPPQEQEPPPTDDEPFSEEPGDKALVVRLGDCRRCAHNLKENADLILVNALKFSYFSLVDAINMNRPIRAAIPRQIPINAQQLLQLINLLPASNITNVGPVEALVWFPPTGPSTNFYDLPFDYVPPIQEFWRGKASPSDIGTFFLTATAHAYNLWRRAKQNQKDCCKKHVLPQRDRKRVTIWIGNLKKKVTV